MSSSGSRRRRTTRAAQEMNVRGEAAYMVERALQADARIVTLGPLLFFSTETGDAWMLDPADHLALCLAKDGEPLPVDIVETADRFSIGWNASYALEGPMFHVVEASGRATGIIGYPIDEIQQAIREMNRR